MEFLDAVIATASPEIVASVRTQAIVSGLGLIAACAGCTQKEVLDMKPGSRVFESVARVVYGL